MEFFEKNNICKFKKQLLKFIKNLLLIIKAPLKIINTWISITRNNVQKVVFQSVKDIKKECVASYILQSYDQTK